MGTSPKALPVTGLGQIAITVRDTERATTFYRDKLGLPMLFTAGQLSFFDCGGVRLMLSTPQGEGTPRENSILYFRVQDLRATHARMRQVGVTFEREPHLVAKMPDHELWMAFFRDSEDNLMALMSEVR